MEVGDSFLFFAQIFIGHSAVGNGDDVAGVKLDGLAEIPGRRLVIVPFVAVIDGAVVVTKRIPRRPRYCLVKKRQPIAVKSQLVKRCDRAIRENRDGADGDALKISFISEAQPVQQFR